MLRAHRARHRKSIASLAVFIANAAGVHQIVALIVVFHIRNIGRKEFCTPLLAVLPNLANRPILCIDTVAHAAGIILAV